MNPSLSFWSSLAGLLATEATLLVALAWLAARWLRSPQMQRAVWQAVLLGITLLWVAELGGARGQLARWLPAERPRRTLSVRVLDAPRTESIAEPFPDEPAQAPLPAVTPPRPVWWPGWLWLAGLTLLTGRLALSRAWLMWCVRRSRGLDPGAGQGASAPVRSQTTKAPRSDASAPDDTGAMVARLSRQLGLGRVRLLVWPRLRGPVAFGVLRPTVALPEDFRTRFSPAQREAMLAHELAHLAARDPLWLTLADLTCALAWWHPAVWWARRQLRSACESAADEAAALVPDGRAALAESLVTFGRELASPRWARGIGVAGDGLKSQLARRVKVLLHTSGGWNAVRPSRLWATRLGATGVVAALVLAPWPGVNGAGLAPVLAMVKAAEPAPPNGAESRAATTDKTKPLATVSDVLRDPQFRAVADGLAAAEPSGSAGSGLHSPGGKGLPGPRQMTNAFIRQSGLGYEIPAPVGQTITTRGYNVTNPADPRAGEIIQRVDIYSNSPPENVIPTTKWAYVPLRPSDEAAAQTLMQDAMRLMEAGQFASGEARFRAAQHLAPSNEIDVLGDIPIAAQETDEAAAQRLIQDGVQRMEARQFDSAEARFRAALYLAPSDALANHYLALNRANRDTPLSSSQPKPVSTGRDRISAKLQEIVLPEVNLPPGTLGEAVQQLQDLVRRHDPEKRGLNFLIEADKSVPTIDPATGQPFAVRPDLDKTIVRLNGVLRDVTLGAALAALTSASATPVAWSVEDHAVVFHRPAMVTLHTRTFRVPATEFRGQLTRFLPTGETNLAVAIRAFCATNGVQLPPIAGRGAGGEGTATLPSDPKAVFFNDTKGLLFVRATVEDLDRIEHAIQSLDLPADDFLRRYESALQAAKQADLDAAPVLAAQGKDSPQAAQAMKRYRDAQERVQLFEQVIAADKELGSLRTRYKDGHPKVKEALVKRSELKARIESSSADTTLPIAPTWAASTPQIAMEVQFAEITERGSDDLGLDWLFGQSPTNNPALLSGPATNLLTEPGSPSGQNLRVDLLRTEGQSATLTDAQFAALRKQLEGRGGVEFLAAPRLVTESGRRARISVGDVRTIVGGVDTTRGSATNQAGISYQTEQIETGPSVDLVPTIEGGATRLAIVAKVTEFLGYDQPNVGQEVEAASPGGKPVKGVMPLPHLRVRSTRADVSAGAGETVVLRGPLVSDTVRMVDKVVGLGDLPLLGRLFRTESTNNVRKRLYVFVTPTEVTRTGERRPAAPKPALLTVSITTATPRFWFGDQAVAEAGLPERLVAALKADPSLVLRIRSASDVPQADVVRLLDAARTAGITRFDLSTEPAAPPGPGR